MVDGCRPFTELDFPLKLPGEYSDGPMVMSLMLEAIINGLTGKDGAIQIMKSFTITEAQPCFGAMNSRSFK